MSGKDKYIFTKAALMSTKCGKEILKQILLRKNSYKQFTKYKQKYEYEFEDFKASHPYTRMSRYDLSSKMLLINDDENCEFTDVLTNCRELSVRII